MLPRRGCPARLDGFGRQPFGDDECRIALVPLDGAARRVLVSTQSANPALSPDGKHLAFSAENELKLADLTDQYQIVGAPLMLAKDPHAIRSNVFRWAAIGRDAEGVSERRPCTGARFRHRLLSADRSQSLSLLCRLV